MRTPHTSCWEGKRVKVRLRNGTEFIDKFWGSKGNYRLFKERGRVRSGDIIRFVIWKGGVQ